MFFTLGRAVPCLSDISVSSEPMVPIANVVWGVRLNINGGENVFVRDGLRYCFVGTVL